MVSNDVNAFLNAFAHMIKACQPTGQVDAGMAKCLYNIIGDASVFRFGDDIAEFNPVIPQS